MLSGLVPHAKAPRCASKGRRGVDRVRVIERGKVLLYTRAVPNLRSLECPLIVVPPGTSVAGFEPGQ
jgi:hypothetical protein